MRPRTAALVIILALGVAAAAWILWAPKQQATDLSSELADPAPAVVATSDQELLPASIYLLGTDGQLHASMIQVPAQDGEARIRAVVEALLAESADDQGLSAPLPAGTRLAGIFFLDTSAVALDLRLPEDARLGGIGSKLEILMIYSLVNSVTLNSDVVDRVVLMVNGQQPETLAGHVDLTRPLAADPSLIAVSS